MNIITILYICGLIGVLDTLYLIYHKVRGTEVACIFFPAEWCHTVQHSPQSKILGIPTSYLGFLMYVLILVMTYMFAHGGLAFWPIEVLVTFGFLFSMYFTYIQAFVLRAFCTWCVLSAINFTVMTLVIYFSA
ncbi:MAG: vitamin K epoxide reductase family protein [Minisyncoccia bacterium]